MPDCCPKGYAYIDSGGNYNDIGLVPSVGILVNYADTQYHEKCAQLALSAPGYSAVLEPIDPIDCPCCPVGFEYSSYRDICQDPNGVQAEPVPCIPCVCPPDPTPVPCDIPASEGERIVLDNPGNGRLCDSCTPQDGNSPGGCIENFLPSNYLDPITSSFRLKNKNFI